AKDSLATALKLNPEYADARSALQRISQPAVKGAGVQGGEPEHFGPDYNPFANYTGPGANVRGAGQGGQNGSYQTGASYPGKRYPSSFHEGMKAIGEGGKYGIRFVK